MDGSHIYFEDIGVVFNTGRQKVRALRPTKLLIKKEKITGIIGETGCGKSVLGLSLLGLLPSYAEVEGSIFYGGRDLSQLDRRERERYLGRVFGYVAQNPGESLNPVRRIGQQIYESIRLVEEDRKKVKEAARSLIGRLGFSQVDRILASYPFQLSGGMQQRVLTAIALGSNPDWILADEPTKGLDREVRDQVIDVFSRVKEEGIKSIIIITHDIELANKLCDEIVVMYSGEVVEKGCGILDDPKHPYTKGFLDSLPKNGMKPMEGRALSATEEVKGCRFYNRCQDSMDKCREKNPDLEYKGDREIRCFLYD